MKYLFYASLLLLSFYSIAYSGTFLGEKYVYANNGLILRADPDINSEPLCIIPDKTKIYFNCDITYSRLITINGISGYWVETWFENKKGWVFSGYISSNPETISFPKFYNQNEEKLITSKIISLKSAKNKLSSIRYEKNVSPTINWEISVINFTDADYLQSRNGGDETRPYIYKVNLFKQRNEFNSFTIQTKGMSKHSNYGYMEEPRAFFMKLIDNRLIEVIAPSNEYLHGYVLEYIYFINNIKISYLLYLNDNFRDTDYIYQYRDGNYYVSKKGLESIQCFENAISKINVLIHNNM